MPVLKYFDPADSTWKVLTAGAGGDSGSGIAVQEEAPADPADGDLWLDTDETGVIWTPNRTGWFRGPDMVDGQIIAGSITPTASHNNAEAYELIDGNTLTAETTWSSMTNSSVGMWVRFDFHENITLNGIRQVVTMYPGDYGKAWDIQGSADAATWTTLGSGSATAGGNIDTAFPASTFRHFQIILTTGSATTYWALDEVEFRVP